MDNYQLCYHIVYTTISYNNGNNYGITYTEFHWSELDRPALIPVLNSIAK